MSIALEFFNYRVFKFMAANVWGFVQWPIRDPGSWAAKSRFWVKVLFLDQITKRP
jgi:hypothetical protein